MSLSAGCTAGLLCSLHARKDAWLLFSSMTSKARGTNGQSELNQQIEAVGLGNAAQNGTSWVLQRSDWELGSGSTEVQEAEWGARVTGPILHAFPSGLGWRGGEQG